MEDFPISIINQSNWMIAVVGMALALCPPLVAQEVHWRHDYDAAMREAEQTARPLLLDFGTAGCSWCRKLDKTTFHAPVIVQLLNERLVPVKIDAEQNERLTQALGIQGFPCLVIASPDGKVQYRHEGYLDASELKPIVDKVLSKFPQSQHRESIASENSSNESEMARCRVVIVAGGGSSATAPTPEPDRLRRARNLVEQARRDLDDGLPMACLERCGLLTAEYADLPQAAEAQRLLDQLVSDSNALDGSRARFNSILGDMYLKRAAEKRDHGDLAAAQYFLEHAYQVCPQSAEIRSALEQFKSDRARSAVVHAPDSALPAPER
jgi:thioredoxin-related protein